MTWDLRLGFVESSRHRVSYEAVDLGNSDGTGSSAEVDTAQLAAYCEAVKRLTAQGIDEDHAAQVLRRCGGDIDAAEIYVGVCSSVGLFSMLDEDDSSESWCWEGAAGHLYFANTLQEAAQSMRKSSTDSELCTVASVIESTASAVTEEMQQEVQRLEAARQQTHKASLSGLSAEAILGRIEFGSGIPRSRITAVHEVLNPVLWRLYSAQKQSMAEPKETWLFHGSGPENIAHICLEGFDLALANPKGSYGAGVYFATDSSTSHSYSRKNPLKSMDDMAPKYDNQSEVLASARANGLHTMLLCTVLLGHAGTYNSGSKAPAGCDSVASSSMSVVYKADQAYPRYVVFFSS